MKRALTGPGTTYSHLGQQATTTTVSATLDSETKQKISQASEVLLQFSNGEEFYFKNLGGLAIYDTDLVLAESKDVPQMAETYAQHLQGGVSSQSNIAKAFSCLFLCFFQDSNASAWPEGKIYFQFTNEITQSERVNFRDAVSTFNQQTNGNPKFIEAPNPTWGSPTTQITKISFFNGGITPPGYVDQTRLARMYFGTYILGNITNKSLILHEMGHAAGLMHEHQRCDRDDYVNIDWSKADGFISSNVNYNQLCQMATQMGPFDYDSLMNYSAYQGVVPKSPRQNGFFVGNWQSEDFGRKTFFSHNDISDGIRFLYPLADTYIDSQSVEGSRTWSFRDIPHGIGATDADGSGWQAVVGRDAANGMLSYGPYVDINGKSGSKYLVGSYNLKIDNNSAGDEIVATLEATTNYGQNILASRPIRRTDFKTPNTYQNFQLLFPRSAGGGYELRLKWHGTAAMTERSVSLREMNLLGTWSATNGSIGHDIGRVDGDGWAAFTGSDRPGFLSFGPYTRVDGNIKQLRGEWDLMVDVPNTPNDRVARLEVVMNSGTTVVAARDIYRSEFKAGFSYQRFELPFTSPLPDEEQTYELRTYWYSPSYMRIKQVQLRGEDTLPPLGQ